MQHQRGSKLRRQAVLISLLAPLYLAAMAGANLSQSDAASVQQLMQMAAQQ